MQQAQLEHMPQEYKDAYAQVAIIPGGYGAYIGEVTTLQPGYAERDFVVPLLERFLAD